MEPWVDLYELEKIEAVNGIEVPVEGKLPPELTGRHFRIGPSGGRSFGTKLKNLFADSDGFVVSYELSQKAVKFSCRHVETPGYLRETAQRRPIYTPFSMPLIGSHLLRFLKFTREAVAMMPFIGHRWFSQIKDPANHTACIVGDQLYLTAGAGRPFAINPETLKPSDQSLVNRGLPRRSMFLVGESHVDPRTGKRCFIEIVPYWPASYRLWELDPVSGMREVMTATLPSMFMLHDFGLTPNYLVIPGGPAQVSWLKLLMITLGWKYSMMDCFPWIEGHPLEFHVVHRDTGAKRKFTVKSHYPVHIANCFEDGDDIVVDMNLHTTDAAVRGYTASIDFNQELPDFQNLLFRIRLSASGEAKLEKLTEMQCEGPTVSPAVEGQKSRFVYTYEVYRGIAAGRRIVKIDAVTKESKIKDFGERCVTSEPLFIPRTGGTQEDDGWVLVQVYDGVKKKSFLSVLAGGSLTEEARVSLPFAVPFLLHGAFQSDARTHS